MQPWLFQCRYRSRTMHAGLLAAPPLRAATAAWPGQALVSLFSDQPFRFLQCNNEFGPITQRRYPAAPRCAGSARRRQTRTSRRQSLPGGSGSGSCETWP